METEEKKSTEQKKETLGKFLVQAEKYKAIHISHALIKHLHLHLGVKWHLLPLHLNAYFSEPACYWTPETVTHSSSQKNHPSTQLLPTANI